MICFKDQVLDTTYLGVLGLKMKIEEYSEKPHQLFSNVTETSINSMLERSAIRALKIILVKVTDRHLIWACKKSKSDPRPAQIHHQTVCKILTGGAWWGCSLAALKAWKKNFWPFRKIWEEVVFDVWGSPSQEFILWSKNFHMKLFNFRPFAPEGKTMLAERAC